MQTKQLVNRFNWGLLIAMVALALPAKALLAAPLLQAAVGAPEPSLWMLVFPLMAASLAVERLIEVLWNYIDWTLLNTRGWEPANLPRLAIHQLQERHQFGSGCGLGCDHRQLYGHADF